MGFKIRVLNDFAKRDPGGLQPVQGNKPNVRLPDGGLFRRPGGDKAGSEESDISPDPSFQK